MRKPTPLQSQTTLDGSTVSTLDVCQINSNPPYAYPPYPPSSILKVRLSTQVEVAHLEVGEEKVVWVAVTATAEAILREEDVPMVPLNIVVVLDNSAYTSTESLKAANRAILDMAGELRHPKDRLAIICTSPAHPWKDTRSGYTLRPLSPVDLTGIQKDLRLAAHARPDIAPQNLNIDQTLADAFYLLANGDDMEATGGEYCHVVIVTANPGSCSSKLGSSAPVLVHILQPASVPWYHADPLVTGHFIADNTSGPGMKDRMRDMLLHARAKANPGTVYDIHISLESISEKCKILEIIGQQHFANMVVGQLVNILCKVKVTQDSASTATSAASKVDALMTEIESMLGMSNIDLLRVILAYRQSLFPSNTTLTVTNTCSAPVVSRTSLWKPKDDVTTTLVTGLQNITELHKKLALCIANSGTPMQALKTLQSLAPPPIQNGIFLSFLSAIKAELSHQIKTITRYNIPISNSFQPPDDEYTHLESPTVAHRTITPLPPDQRPLSPVAESPDSAKTTIHKRHHSPTEDNNTDAARKIWKDMKRDSQSTKDLMIMRSVTMGALGMRDGRLQEIQRQAVRNKRSIGADTLRSMSLGTGTGTASDEFQSRYAPWA